MRSIKWTGNYSISLFYFLTELDSTNVQKLCPAIMYITRQKNCFHASLYKGSAQRRRKFCNQSPPELRNLEDLPKLINNSLARQPVHIKSRPSFPRRKFILLTLIDPGSLKIYKIRIRVSTRALD